MVGVQDRDGSVARLGGAAGPAEDELLARNQDRQRELYGEPLGGRVRRLQAALGVSQARLARSLGLSPAMLSQLVSGRRVKIGDPGVLGRMLLLERQLARPGSAGRAEPGRAEALLDRIAGTRPGLVVPTAADPADALRGVASPAQLAAAANVLGPRFPVIAEVLRRAAAERR